MKSSLTEWKVKALSLALMNTKKPEAASITRAICHCQPNEKAMAQLAQEMRAGIIVA